MSNETNFPSENAEFENSGLENKETTEETSVISNETSPTAQIVEAPSAPTEEAIPNIEGDIVEKPDDTALAQDIAPENTTPAEEPAPIVQSENIEPAEEAPQIETEAPAEASMAPEAPVATAETPAEATSETEEAPQIEITQTVATEEPSETPVATSETPVEIAQPSESLPEQAPAVTVETAPVKQDEEKASEPDPKQQAKDERNALLDSLFEELKLAKANEAMVEVDVKSRIRGGLRVMYGELPIFLPASHFSMKRNPPEEEMQEVVGKRIPVYIHEVQDDGGNRRTVIVSRKKILESEFWDKLNIGDIVEGNVSSIATFGIFLDIGGIEGLIHISRLSQTRVENTQNFAKKGQRMRAVVVEIDKSKKRIALSRKELEDSPWAKVEEKYAMNSQHNGIVRRLTDFGAYVELEPGIDGLLRTAEISWLKRVKKPSDVLKIGQELAVQILSISIDKQTMSLSHRRTLPNPWSDIQTRYPIGTEYKGIISQVMPQGAIVCINDDIDGFMPRSKMKNLSRGKKIPFQVGEEVEVIISELSPEQESLILAPKAEEMQAEPERQSNNFKRGNEPKPQQESSNAPEGAFTLMDLLSDKDKSTLFKVTE